MQYTYRCPECRRVTERSFPLAGNPERVLCECGEWAERFIPSAPTVQYKGSGWASKTSAGPKSQDEADLPGGAADSFTGRTI